MPQHALNNAIGHEFLTEENMNDACQTFLQEMHFEGAPEHLADHQNEDGWYSEAVMAKALQAKQNIFVMDLDHPLRADGDDLLARAYAPDVMGIVVNHPGVHWVALRIINNIWWLLDSQRQPRHLSLTDAQSYIRRYRNAFLIRALPDA